MSLGLDKNTERSLTRDLDVIKSENIIYSNEVSNFYHKDGGIATTLR